MKVTVCQLNADPDHLPDQWQALIEHVQTENSRVVLLPEMPFAPWFATCKAVNRAVWNQAVEKHNEWESRLPELQAEVVIGTRPVNQAGKHLNIGFIWTPDQGVTLVHPKVYLPDEPGFWEASWYDRGPKEFQLVEAAGAKIGFLICTEMWFMEHARAYAKDGVHLLVCPRSTPVETVNKWITGGRTAAVVSGAYCLSANHCGHNHSIELGGTGWVVDPDGNLLGITSNEAPFLTYDIDLEQANRAKKSYPRYVIDD